MSLFCPFSGAAQAGMSVSAQGGAKQKRVPFSRPGLAGTMAMTTGGRMLPACGGLLDARLADRPPRGGRTYAQLRQGPAFHRLRCPAQQPCPVRYTEDPDPEIPKKKTKGWGNMSKTRMGKRVASLLLSLVMMLSLLPTTVYAEGADGAATNDAVVEETIAPVNAEGVDAVDSQEAESSGDEVSGESGGTANVSEGATVTVATIGEAKYETLDAAIEAVQDGEIIEVNAREYKLPGSQTLYAGKAFTIKAADGATVSFDMSAAVALHGAKITFNNVTFNYKTNGNYIGLQHADTLVYNNCTINGVVFLYAVNETFNNCTFNQESADAYNVWTYGAQNVAFNGCTFKCVGKAVLVYNEGAIAKTDLTVTDTKFIASALVEGKAAIEIDTSLMKGGATITVDEQTKATGFANGSNSGSALWNDKKQTTDTNKNTTVTVAGVEVFVPKATASAVAKIGNTEYATLADAIAAANAGDTVTLLADCASDRINLETKSITVDLNGKVLTSTAEYGVMFCAKNGNTITINGTTAGSKLVGTLMVTNGTYGHIVINGGTYESDKYCPIYINGAVSTDGSTLTVTNATIEALAGSSDQDNGVAVYLAGYSTSTFTNTTITAPVTGLEIRAGKLTLTDCNVTGGNGTVAAKADGNGSTVANAAVAISQHTTKKNIDVTINGGTYTATAAVYQTDVQKTGSENVKASIKSGTFNGTVSAETNNTVAVSGGSFSSAVPENCCAAGYIPVANDGGTYTVKQVVYVAETNNVKYETLQEAITAARKNATVKLLADTRENVTINNAMTLDLNGHTLNGGTEKGKPALTVKARVTVKDSSEAQTGTIMREDTAENSGVSSHYVIDIQGRGVVMTFESGNVKNNSGNADRSKGASLVRVGDDSITDKKANPTLTINGGTFTQDNFIAIKVDRGYLNLNGGTLNSANTYAVENWFRATIKGGTVNGAVSSWTYSAGSNSTLTIEDGTVNGTVTSVNYGSAADKQARVYITGGTVNGELDTRSYDPKTGELTSIVDAAKATIKVSGGTFNNAVEARYCDEGYTPVQISDGKYGVQQQQQVLAKIGDTAYYTMYEAFRAVQANETIVMQRDYTTGAEQYSGSKSFTIDLNDKTWTYTGTNTNHAAFEINHSDVTLTVKNGTVVSNSMVGLIPSAIGMDGPIAYDNAGLVFDGVTMTANGYSGIETNGSNTSDTVTLKNSTLNVPNGFGIYFPSSGTLTIDNSTITAKTMGVQVCAGSLSINAGSAITVTGDAVPKTENDGAIQDGAAISIVNRAGYKGLGDVTVTGGKFTAKTGNAAIKAYNWDNTESAFTANGTVAVSGGTFSSAVPEGLCAEGYISVANADGTHTVEKGVYVAKVDNVKYETLQKAINAAKGGSTVRLLADVTLTETAVFPAGKKVDLNLVGHNITATGTALLINGTTDIQSTGGNGVIESTGNVAVAVGDNAKVAVFSGTLKGREGAVITGTSTGATIEIRGSKATLIATDNAVIAGNGSERDGDPNNITIRNGTFIGSITTTGYIACGIYAPWNDNVTVSGGTFNITNGAGIVARAGTVKVTGGTFNCTGTAEGYVGDSKNKVPCAALVFDEAANYPALKPVSKILVSGGKFSTDPAANGATLADGYIATQTDGMYKVAKADPVAEINGVKYDTLQAAIAALEDKGGTIKLLQDINTPSMNYKITENITIDLNGHNITGSGAEGVFYVYTSGHLTITGDGVITAVENNKAAIAVQVFSANAKVTLEGGTYKQKITNINDPHFDLIYVYYGTAEIKGGTYEGATPNWTLNCKDETYQSKEAKIEVTGGTFYGFDPSANHEGEGTTYVKTGYVSTKNGDGTYTVEQYLPVEVWTGFAGKKVASYATIGEAVANLGENKWIVIAKNYTLDKNFTIGGEGFDNLYLDVAKGATLTVAEGVTLTVAANAKRLGVREDATVVNNGTILVCGSSTSNGFAMLYGTFTGNALTVPEGYFLDNNGKNFFATANEKAVYEITFGDGTVKKTADSTNIKGGNVKQIKLLQNVTKGGWTLDSSSVGPEVVLDLNGHTLSYDGANRYYATLNVYTKVTIKNGTVKYEGSERGAIDLVGQGDLTIESDVIIDGGDAFAIFTSGTSKLTVNGTVKANGNYAIAGNGSKDAGGYIDSCNITVNDGAAIRALNGVAIYHPEKGTVTINGGTITGHTGVQMCSGELVINGGTIVTTGAKGNIGNDGGILDGAAVSIINRSYPGGTPTATIAGGTFTSANGIVAVQAYTVSGTTASEWTDVAEYVNISGGTFSSIPDNMAALCKVGYRAVEDKDNNVYIVKEANIAIQVTSRIKDDGVTTVSTTTGGGMYCEGEKVTVTTSNVVGFKFLGWYEKDSYMTQRSADLSYTFTASKNCTLVALYSPAENATLTVKVTASAFKINGSKWVQNNGGMYKLPVGSSVTVTYTDDTYTFLYWVNGSDKIVSTSPEYTFTLGSNTELRACTSPKNTDNDNAMVVFKTAYDQVLTAKRYGNDEEIVFPMGPSKTGYKFIGWSMTQTEIRAAMAENDYIVVTPKYETLGTKYTVTVKYEGIEKVADTHTINVGDSILLTAAETVGEKTFSYWMIDNQIVSYLTTLTVFESKDVTVTAVYGVEANAEAKIRITDTTAVMNGQKYQLVFTQAYALPENATLISTGFIRATDESAAANLTLEHFAYQYVSKHTENEGVYELRLNRTSSSEVIYVRAYVQYTDADGKLQTSYSDVVHASYDILTKGGNN